MTYAITAIVRGKKKTKKVTGVPALHSTLAALRARGFVIDDISRVLQ